MSSACIYNIEGNNTKEETGVSKFLTGSVYTLTTDNKYWIKYTYFFNFYFSNNSDSNSDAAFTIKLTTFTLKYWNMTMVTQSKYFLPTYMKTQDSRKLTKI